jgi:hypothetical protein
VSIAETAMTGVRFSQAMAQANPIPLLLGGGLDSLKQGPPAATGNEFRDRWLGEQYEKGRWLTRTVEAGVLVVAPLFGELRAAQSTAEGGIAAAEATPAFEEGSFSIIDWTGYPANVPKPKGPLRVLVGEEYAAARAAANERNAAIRIEHGLQGSGLDIHEIQPVKFGGSPTDPANKMLLSAPEHTGPNGIHPRFWTPLLRFVTGSGG